MESVRTSKKTSSGQVHTGEGMFYALLLGCDGTNNPTITIYDGTDNTGTEILPTVEYDALALGLNGVVLKAPIKYHTGIYVEITCAGTVEAITHYRERENYGIG